LHSVVKRFSRAWNRADLPGLARFFAEEGLLVMPLDGPAHPQVIHSRLGREHEPVRGTRLSAQIAAIDFPTENIAVVKGSYRITGVQARPRSRRTAAGPFIFRLERTPTAGRLRGRAAIELRKRTSLFATRTTNVFLSFQPRKARPG
jgi:hypothetical protein